MARIPLHSIIPATSTMLFGEFNAVQPLPPGATIQLEYLAINNMNGVSRGELQCRLDCLDQCPPPRLLRVVIIERHDNGDLGTSDAEMMSKEDEMGSEYSKGLYTINKWLSHGT